MRLKYLLTVILFILGLVIFMNVSKRSINDIGFELFQWVKKVRGDNVKIENIQAEATIPVDHDIWDKLLIMHVNDRGLVDYKGFMKNGDKLNAYLSLVSNNPPSDNWTKKEKMAYWINAYNAFTIKLIIDHYPVKSIRDIAGSLSMINSSWDIKFFKIGGVDFDLNTIEHEILRKEFDDPRIHFAINCASISCPQLRNEAYDAQILEFQLEDQTRLFINDTSRNIVLNDRLQLSSIFDWFKGDFTKESSLIEYLSQYVDRPINKNLKIIYFEYDWKLNDYQN